MSFLRLGADLMYSLCNVLCGTVFLRIYRNPWLLFDPAIISIRGSDDIIHNRKPGYSMSCNDLRLMGSVAMSKVNMTNWNIIMLPLQKKIWLPTYVFLFFVMLFVVIYESQAILSKIFVHNKRIIQGSSNYTESFKNYTIQLKYNQKKILKRTGLCLVKQSVRSAGAREWSGPIVAGNRIKRALINEKWKIP